MIGFPSVLSIKYISLLWYDELPLNYHDHVLQLSHTKIIKNIVSCILQFLIYYYYINNADMCALFVTKTKLLLDWHSMSHVVITSLINDHVYIFLPKRRTYCQTDTACHLSLMIACIYDWNAWLRLLRHTLSQCMKHLYIFHLLCHTYISRIKKPMINAILFSNILFLLNYFRFYYTSTIIKNAVKVSYIT